MKHPASSSHRNAVHACAAGLFAAVALLFAVPAQSAGQSAAEQTKKELIEIMKGVNFVPQLGKDTPICKTFYEDFKKQTNIEHIQPIVRADSYDDPALKSYRDQCPNFDFRKSLSVPANQDTTGWTEEEWEAVGTPTYGLGNFQIYHIDIDNNPKNGEELVFYYEGTRTIVKRLPYGKPMTEEEYVDPAARGYQTLDLKHCKKSLIGGAGFNTGGAVLVGSAQVGGAGWTQNGIIRYKGMNAIYILENWGEKQDYLSLNLNLYSVRLKRIAPTCTYRKPR